jgi:hypothetical protein
MRKVPPRMARGGFHHSPPLRTMPDAKTETTVRIRRDTDSLSMRRAGVPVSRGRCSFILSATVQTAEDLNRQFDLRHARPGYGSRWLQSVPHHQ